MVTVVADPNSFPNPAFSAMRFDGFCKPLRGIFGAVSDEAAAQQAWEQAFTTLAQQFLDAVNDANPRQVILDIQRAKDKKIAGTLVANHKRNIFDYLLPNAMMTSNHDAPFALQVSLVRELQDSNKPKWFLDTIVYSDIYEQESTFGDDPVKQKLSELFTGMATLHRYDLCSALKPDVDWIKNEHINDFQNMDKENSLEQSAFLFLLRLYWYEISEGQNNPTINSERLRQERHLSLAGKFVGILFKSGLDAQKDGVAKKLAGLVAHGFPHVDNAFPKIIARVHNLG